MTYHHLSGTFESSTVVLRYIMRKISELKKFAKINKNKDVVGEYIFRQALLKFGIHYQRQKVIVKYIVDFYLPWRNLIIEIDGNYHAGCKEYDEMRQKDLERYGFLVLRFTDHQVENDINFCIEQVLFEIETNKKYRACKVRLKELNNYKNRVSFASTTKNKLASVI